jgi:hypothetical protein
MRGRMLVMGMVAALIGMTGCARAVVPATVAEQAKVPAIQGRPIADPSPDDVAALKLLQVDVEFAPDGTPAWHFAQLPDVSSAEASYTGALFPTETFGRRLVGIVLETPADPGRQDPQAVLHLLYEGRLEVTQSIHKFGTASHGPPPKPGAPLPETTSVAGVPGEVSPRGAEAAYVRWIVGDRINSVHGPGLTREQLLAVARSMRPLDTPSMPSGTAQ